MAFRIDETRQQGHRWVWHIKGLDGEGLYCTLATNTEGCGLYVVSVGDRQIFPPEGFTIPEGSDVAEANRLLAITLYHLGWGPQVDQRGEPIPRTSRRPV